MKIYKQDHKSLSATDLKNFVKDMYGVLWYISHFWTLSRLNESESLNTDLNQMKDVVV